MEELENELGKVITFYSYKGGVGRSMALANLAVLYGAAAAKQGKKILVMDWDLEAPGLHRYFLKGKKFKQTENKKGVIDLFAYLSNNLSRSNWYDTILNQGWLALEKKLNIDDYLIEDVFPGVSFMKAGEFTDHYPGLVNSFRWADFYKNYNTILGVIREYLTIKYSHVLIDSRTGFGDESGICTMLLPEVIVALFAPNNQGLLGTTELAEKAINYRISSSDMRPLAVFPVPSRIEGAEHALRLEWRERYQKTFEGLFERVYDLTSCNLDNYFDEIQLPHVSYYSYGEKIAVLEKRSDLYSLNRSYKELYDCLLTAANPCEFSTYDRLVKEDRKVVVALIRKKNGQFLLTRRRQPEGVFKWGFPAKLMTEAISVKKYFPPACFSETGITPVMKQKIGSRFHPDTKRIVEYWLCDYGKGRIKILDPDELAELRWVSGKQARRLITSDLFEPVSHILRGRNT